MNAARRRIGPGFPSLSKVSIDFENSAFTALVIFE
jgi:hypothetical protein